jgi:hypothetical protein
MILKIVNRRTKRPRRRIDLRRRIQYLFRPQTSLAGPHVRLLGPPDLHRLVLTHHPWGKEVDLAADELARQMDAYCRAACRGRSIPDVWFVHAIVAFPPAASTTLRSPTDPHGYPARGASQAHNAYRIARDLLSKVGWEPFRPSLFVAHADKKHIHVHVLALIPAIGRSDWDVMQFSRVRLNEYAKIAAVAFQVPQAGRTARERLRSWQQLLE